MPPSNGPLDKHIPALKPGNPGKGQIKHAKGRDEPTIEAFTTDAQPMSLTARPDVRLRQGRPVSQYAGCEGCAG